MKEIYCQLCGVRLIDYENHKPKMRCPNCKRIFRVEGKSEPYTVTQGGFNGQNNI